MYACSKKNVNFSSLPLTVVHQHAFTDAVYLQFERVACNSIEYYVNSNIAFDYYFLYK